MSTVAAAIAEGLIGQRLWIYTNYKCNLTCRYCLTESGPRAAGRELPLERLPEIATEARALGFEALGVTGGEPFLLRGLPETLAEAAAVLPTLVLTNATLFSRPLLARLAPLAAFDFRVQVSLDSADPAHNDGMRGVGNFAKVQDAIPKLRRLGIPVRVATTTAGLEPEELARLCELHRSLGVPDEDHVVRPIVHRGRAVDHGLGVRAVLGDLPPELTITADGAFWSPFGPTVHGGRLDTDLLLTRATRPLSIPTDAMLQVAGSAGNARQGSDGLRIH